MDYEANGPDEKRFYELEIWGGIYRKEFIIDKSNKIVLSACCLDGVYQDATVYLNGEKLGNNYYGYIPFEFDITNKVNIGEVNTLLVRVDIIPHNPIQDGIQEAESQEMSGFHHYPLYTWLLMVLIS